MNDPESAEWWRELESFAARLGPAFDVRTCGACPSCRQGPRQAVPLSGVPWMRCTFCGFIWGLADQPYDVPPLPPGEEGDDLYEALFYELAGHTVVQPLFLNQTPTATGEPMKAFKTFVMDLWPGARDSSDVNGEMRDSTKAPIGWTKGLPSHRERWGAAVVLAQEPEAVGLRCSAFMILRAHCERATDLLAEPPGPRADWLGRFYVQDATERKRWAEAVRAAQDAAVSPNMLALAALKIAAAGSALDVLRQQRADIDRRIAVLEQRCGQGEAAAR